MRLEAEKEAQVCVDQSFVLVMFVVIYIYILYSIIIVAMQEIFSKPTFPVLQYGL